MKQNFDDLISVLEAEIKFRGILKKDLAEAAGIAPHTVSVILARKHVPGAAVLVRLFNAVGLEVFLRRVEDEEE
jgi:transcriptional regulator with XRE-family HTH domain